MAVVLYYGTDEKGNHRVEGLQGEDFSTYLENEATGAVVGSLAGLIVTLEEEGYAKRNTEKGEFYVDFTTNDSYVGFILVYDVASKELVEITVDNNGEQNQAFASDEFDTFLDSEDLFPIFSTLGVGD